MALCKIVVLLNDILILVKSFIIYHSKNYSITSGLLATVTYTKISHDIIDI